MRRMISASTALILSFLLAGCGGHGSNALSPSVVPQSLPSSTTMSQVHQVRHMQSASAAATPFPVTIPGPNYYTPWAGLSTGAIPIGNDVGTSRCGIIQGWGGPAYCNAVPVGDPQGILKNIPILVPAYLQQGCQTVESSWFATDPTNLLSYVTFKPQDEFVAYGQDQRTLVSINVAGQPAGTLEQVYVMPSALNWATAQDCTAPCPPPATPGPNPTKAILLTGSKGEHYIGADGAFIMRPDDGHDPAFFEHLGYVSGPVTGAILLRNFQLGHIWDEQRPLANVNNMSFALIDYASLVIGLFGCEANMSSDKMLSIYEGAAITMGSKWSKKAERDKTGYPLLPASNVGNVRYGYTLCQNHTFPFCQ